MGLHFKPEFLNHCAHACRADDLGHRPKRRREHNLPVELAIPGMTYKCFLYSCGNSDLAKAVATFNSSEAGKTAFERRQGTDVEFAIRLPFGSPDH